MFQNPFSFEGRIRRSEFVLSLIAFYIASFLIIIMIGNGDPPLLRIFGFAYIPALWFLWAQGVKRCHDLDKSGWWLIIPYYFLWMLFEDGKPGPNEYGDNPKGLYITKDRS
jgi:uncharacterized membrane protein YhaH (DUF805 family)